MICHRCVCVCIFFVCVIYVWDSCVLFFFENTNLTKIQKYIKFFFIKTFLKKNIPYSVSKKTKHKKWYAIFRIVFVRYETNTWLLKCYCCITLPLVSIPIFPFCFAPFLCSVFLRASIKIVKICVVFTLLQ